MNRIRNQFAAEVEQLCPVLHEMYRRIGVFQKRRTERNRRLLLEQLAVVGPRLAFFKPYLQRPKQAYFDALADPSLGISDRIVALDVAVGAMHIDFPMARAYMHRESRRLREVLAACRLCPEQLRSSPPDAGDGALVTGIGASPGVVVGAAHIARRTSDYRRLPEGAILVTTMPRPEFIEHLRVLAGIVTDQGSSLCHAAIVARELHLPCVVGTDRATKRIKTGWRIRVDGSAGTVTRT